MMLDNTNFMLVKQMWRNQGAKSRDHMAHAKHKANNKGPTQWPQLTSTASRTNNRAKRALNTDLALRIHAHSDGVRSVRRMWRQLATPAGGR